MTHTAQTTPKRTISRAMTCRLLGCTDNRLDSLTAGLTAIPAKRSHEMRYDLAAVLDLATRLGARPPRPGDPTT